MPGFKEIVAGLVGAMSRSKGTGFDSGPLPTPRPMREPMVTASQLLGYVDGFFRDDGGLRTVNRYQWFLDVALFSGAHWVTWNNYTRTFSEPHAPPHRVRMTINRILVAVQIAQAKMLMNRPQGQPVPSSEDEADYAAAEIGEQILDGEGRRLDIQGKLEEAVLWELVTGNAFGFVGWDPTDGPAVRIPGGEQTPEAAGEGGPTEQFAPRGEVLAEIVNPFEIVVPGGLVNFRDCTSIGREMLMPVAKARRKFRERGSDLQGEENISEKDLYVAQLQGLMGPRGIHGPTPVEGYVMIRQVWQQAVDLTDEEREIWPHGRVVSSTADRILDVQDWPFFYTDKDGVRVDFDIPFVHFGFWPIPGRFWCHGIVDHIAGLARIYNRHRSRIIENANLHGNPYWTTPTGTGFTRNRIDPEPGRIYKHTGPAPTQHSPQEISSSTYEAMMRHHLEDMDVVSGINDVSRGELPKSMSGVGINLLIEQDNTRIGIPVKRFERAYAALHRKILERVRQFWLEPRAVRALGEESEYDYGDFLGADLRDCVDFDVTEGSAMPVSRMARQAELYDLLEKGRIPQDPEIVAALWKRYGVGDVKKAFLDTNPDLARARWENARLRHGNQVAPRPVEDHEVHLAEHRTVMKGPGWERLSPQAQQAFIEHIYLTEQLAAPPEPPPQPQAEAMPGGQEAEQPQLEPMGGGGMLPGPESFGMGPSVPGPMLEPAPLPGLGPIPEAFAPQIQPVQEMMAQPPGGFPFLPII